MLDIEGIRSMLHLKTDVVLADQTVHVSTVDLSLAGFTSGKGFETCVFFEDGESEVVEWYATADLAIAGHSAWKRPAVLSYVIEGIKR